MNGTSGVYSNKIPWRGSKTHLPKTEFHVPNVVNSGISAFSGRTDAHCLVLQIFTGDGLCLPTKWQNNLENISGHNFS